MKGKDQKKINKVFDLFYKAVNDKIDNFTNDNEALFVNAIKRYPSIIH
jgi:hypothetical protein